MTQLINTYGLLNPVETMEAFHELGQETLEEILRISASPYERKKLRTWGIVAAAELVGKSTQTLRRLEKEGKIPRAKKNKENGKKEYTLAEINHLRELLKTKYVRPPTSTPMVLSVANFKGGVAKTTTALLLAQKCALEGLKVLLIDLDPQATLTLMFGYIPDLHLTDDDTIATSILENPNDIKRVVKKTYFEGIDIIAGNSDLQQAELYLPDDAYNKVKELGSPLRRLKAALPHVMDNYDVIIIDCPPNLGALTMNSVAASNGMLVPVPPAMPDFGSFVRFTKSLATLFQSIKPEFHFFRILLSKHKGNSAANQLDKEMKKKFASYMLINHMVDTSEIDTTSSSLISIYEKTSNGATKTYRRAADAADKVNEEIINAFKEIWFMQSSAIKEVVNG